MQHQSSPRQPDFNRLQRLWRSLRIGAKAIAKFMVHPANSTPRPEIHESTRRYHAKAKYYPYLSVEEEQRDWLEHLYHQL
ncbi:MAG: hypothetical protein AAGD25_24730 [Cyanobacteria bacterium P01_F01_bin.150]